MNINTIDKYTMENEQDIGNSSNFVEIEQMKKYPPIDVSKLKLNPFTQELTIPATLLTDCGKYVWSDDEQRMIPATAVVEKAKYTRIYRSASLRDIAMRLSPGAIKLLVWMMYAVEDANDWIRVMPEMYAKSAGKGASRTQYKKAVDELIQEGYICKTQFNYTYWINPAIHCAGNRIDKYPDKVIVKNVW